MSLNVELLDKVLAKIESEPKRWNQGWWLTQSDGDINRGMDGLVPVNCGTAFCFAGWAVTMTGGQWVSRELVLADPDLDGTATWTASPGGTLREVTTAQIRACAVLGITADEGDQLFDGGNNIEDIKNIIESLKRSHNEL